MRRHRETVLVRRTVQVELVPAGTPVELEEGTWAEVTQALGSSFTLLVEGQLVRLRGSDADAIGKQDPTPSSTTATCRPATSSPWCGRRCAPATTRDPDQHRRPGPGLPLRAAALRRGGRQAARGDRHDLTAPGCGMGEVIANEVNDKVLNLPRVEECTVNMVFDPPWDRSMMTEEAKLALGL
jgi:hypothetical protein